MRFAWATIPLSAILRRAVRRLRRDRRGSVATIMGFTALPLVMAVGMGVEVTYWTVVKLRLQRMADTAALAGALEYQAGNNPRNATNAAANLAELNGASGSATRTWNATTGLLLDNQVTVQVVAGVRSPTNTAVKVVVTQVVPLMLTQVMSALPSVTISATAWAEVIPRLQPCILALAAGGAGISAQGSVSVQLTGCTMRSNASISTGGSAALSASAFYAAGSITGNETGGPLHPNAETIPDPYARYGPVRSAFNNLAPGYGPSFADKPKDSATFSPGTWSSWDIQGSVTLDPGIYYVNGPVSLGAQASLSGTGVTIVASGPLTMRGGSSLALSAATTASASNEAIAGIVFAGTSTSDSSFYGNTNPSLTGVLYYPYGNLDFGGTAQSSSTGCLELIAQNVTLKGNPSLAANCRSYGTLTFSSDNTPSATLVQ